MKLEPTDNNNNKDGSPVSLEKTISIEDDSMVVSHHSYDNDEELDERKFPQAEIA